ncbi:hypothetical protein SAMN05443428_102164 [Caloramator quimbayensis]|uniref:Amylo-alpha-1,6-glucosidase n=1 Tax=Caloramator quimbayensis TaxID=1147123 RepID=A0A1T4WP37_9CLOT|nr:hypothetical protein [Caloramator quimbayensis]SKA78645.1 hypothetical protein SAMN05443428_102164 [Caloramator quimbayensis]
MDCLKHMKISKKNNLKDLYGCFGNRVYLIGAQDGTFPDFGNHIKYEMGGIWDHPIKLMDGYWIKLIEDDKKVWLESALEYTTGSFFNELKYKVEELNIEVLRHEFCPDDIEGYVVCFTIKNLDNRGRNISLEFYGKTELRGVWTSDWVGAHDEDDFGEYVKNLKAVVAYDEKNPWFVAFGSDFIPCEYKVEKDLYAFEKTKGRGITGYLKYDLCIAPLGKEDIRFFIAGSCNSRKECIDTLNYVRENHKILYNQKEKRINDLLQRSDINICDKDYKRVFDWIKINYDMLNRKVAGIGEGLGAGIPEYPWWFGTDSSYALYGAIALGQFDLAKNTLRLLMKISKEQNGNGRIIHEVVTNGVVSNDGNTQETPHFIKMVYYVFLWTGDVEFLKEMSF